MTRPVGRPPKPSPQFRLEIQYVPASEADANYAISALALMYRHVTLRGRGTLAAIRRAEALPGIKRP